MTPPPGPPPPGAAEPPGSRRWLLWAVPALALLVTAGVVAAVVSRPADEPRSGLVLPSITVPRQPDPTGTLPRQPDPTSTLPLRPETTVAVPRPPSPTLTVPRPPAPTATVARQPVPGFGEGTLRVLVVSPGTGLSPADHCSLLAATPAQQARGMMTRRDFAGYASMVFPYDRDVTYAFYNRNVPMALTVAWFAGDGRWLGSKDLEPCPDAEGCPTISPPAPFRTAVEVEKGGLGRLGLGPGSQIGFTPGC